VAGNSEWETEICVINTDASQSLSGTLRAYGDDGRAASQEQSVTLSPNGRRQITVGAEFSQPETVGYMTLETDSGAVAGYTKFFIDGRYRVAVPAVSDINSGDIYVPHIASDADWWTGLSLVNTTDTSKDVMFEFNDGSVATWTVPAKGHRAFTVKDLFGGQVPDGLESAVITNAAGVVGLELFGGSETGGNNYLSGVLLKDDRANALYYPHIASDEVWWTGLVAYNPNETATDLAITPYAADGTALTGQTMTLGPFEKYIGAAAQLKFPAQTAWFKIQSEHALTGFELFGTNNGEQLAGYTGVNIAAKSGVFAKTETDGWTGVAFVNIEDDPAQIKLTAYDDAGTVVATGVQSLGGYAKSVDTADQFFDSDIASATYIQYASDNNIVGFQLNGSSDNMHLDALPGLAVAASQRVSDVRSYPIVDTGQIRCYDTDGMEIACPDTGESLYGQDADHTGNAPDYADNGDGTVTDNVTGLMWRQNADTDGDGDIDVTDKMTFDEAAAGAASFSLAGYTDWRLPTIKELYSLILFSGIDVSGYEGTGTSGLTPFMDADYFDVGYGDADAGERIIDGQYATSTRYVHTTMQGDETMFGVNFVDGRIKGYGLTGPGGSEKTFYVIYVRGNTGYGINNFSDNGDKTVTDSATGLMWSQDDSGTGMDWQAALDWAARKNAENYLGYSDWRLPNAKELQSIVDYTRSPDTTASAAVDPVFNTTAITNEAGESDYPFFWSSTTHKNFTNTPGKNSAYVSFGRAMGHMGSWIDVHGAGAQRSDPKIGDPADYPTGHGPQGDAVRIYNYVRLVRDAD
jgi:hypothetical protein